MRTEKNNGFTLVETIIYTALLAVFASALVSFSFSMLGLHVRALSAEEVLDGARTIDRILSYYIENEAIVDKYDNTRGASTSLELMLDDGRQWKLYTDKGRLWQRIDSLEPEALSNSEIMISNLLIEDLGAGSGSSYRVSCNIDFANSDSLDYNYSYEFLGTYNINHDN